MLPLVVVVVVLLLMMLRRLLCAEGAVAAAQRAKMLLRGGHGGPGMLSLKTDSSRQRLRGPGDDVPAEGAVVAQEGGDAAAVAELHQHAQPPLPPLRLPVSAVQS